MDGEALSVSLDDGPHQFQELPVVSEEQRHESVNTHHLAESVVDGEVCCHQCHTSYDHA